MSLFGQAKRHAPPKPRRSPLPVFAGDSEKFSLSSPTTTGSPLGNTSRWLTFVVIPIPANLPFGSRDSPALGNGYGQSKIFHSQNRGGRHIRVPLPIPPRLFARLSRLHPVLRIALAAITIAVVLTLSLGLRKNGPAGRKTWSPLQDPSTVVLTPPEIAKIWEWEVLSGHHPSLAEVPASVPIQQSLVNPIVPANLLSAAKPTPNAGDVRRTPVDHHNTLVGKGPARNYIAPWDKPLRSPGFPPRPVPGAVMDLDIILEKCDYSTNKYVRDCLELLRIGGNLDNGKRVRRGNYLAPFRQMYLEDEFTPVDERQWTPLPPPEAVRPPSLSRDSLSLPPPNAVTPAFSSLEDPCDPLHPRIFHMFWAGAFTDKPYMAVMSFLYTQNLGLDRNPDISSSSTVRKTCRPQFWVWINPGPAAAVPNPSAKREMYETLATNPWSAPFLHERFREVVKFKMWNTTEQLDGIPEMKPYWRDMPIFNSGGNVYKQSKLKQPEPKADVESEVEVEAEAEANANTGGTPTIKKKDGLYDKVGSASESDYDRLSVILSDMARFVLTYRYGGIYLDADTLFLRDWEELWNYRGQFAYRWSFHKKYNTAVLKLHKGSALSTFLFKTALENGLDFHPMTVSSYLKDAGLDKLLVRIPDALFDPAWLNMERLQRDRPPFPYFNQFSVFFSNDKFDTAGPEQLGFDGFFRGAYSYHFHNFWWLPFDASRNWPDLGERFAKGENALREAQRAVASSEKAGAVRTHAAQDELDDEATGGVTKREDMDDAIDLSWSTVLKRTFESYVRGDQPNMYGEWIKW
ncbi:hypothetical protein CcaverHIS002_0205920 [Cutaneotrichosporon cavernicola]|uniref:Glycosyltransferase family 32 protein n=1 Tax=Cutaneotrichosporon cavernicola TaxID=279322 RepID=A0AA48L001_9TREE|nr:uncharacterized protein CcaverHIS019_0205880 [Cutaneotrichosporon cavernicola]BEI81432.1 hypothetical protein CcaverHIS002_0205920 [Cutaneotrichosporon cavernicola]BEI89226.1 hypothetical protein CcaverHIS019_0205880 [Cutaneotrichosporon cavernicola]BEI97001.1 hypothetical protein CcaverHIS631_0205900 [Cutaneotrichosporon cavernicola]BEJ04775.1 hypothetical protein CcaverHIS641_0205920 [Cutaneotrichosporon cavernicola]